MKGRQNEDLPENSPQNPLKKPPQTPDRYYDRSPYVLPVTTPHYASLPDLDQTPLS